MVKYVWVEYRKGCSEGDIHGADKTELFYSLVLDGTFKFEGEKCAAGRRRKSLFTVLMCVNLNGTDKKTVFVEKSCQPRCFKNLKILLVKYAANNKVWMASDIFQQYVSRENNKG
jgi:hypothetical protein